MAISPLRVKLSSPPDVHRVTIASFLRSVRHLETLMREVSGALSEDSIRWYLTDLAIGSGIAEVSGEWMVAEGNRALLDPQLRRELEVQITDTVVTGLAVLNSGQGRLPDAFTWAAVEAAVDLAALGTRDDEVIAIEVSAPKLQKSVELTNHVISAAKELVARGYTDYSAIEGQVTMVSISREPSFSLRDELTGSLVTCSFPVKMADVMKDMLYKRVSVRGRVTYAEDGKPVRLRTLDDIEVIEPERDFVLDAFVGIAPDFTDGLPAEEYLRRSWDEPEQS